MKLLSILAGALAAVSLAGSAYAIGPKAYVGNFKDNTVSVIDTDAGRAIATVPVAAGPDGIVIARDNSQVFVSGSGASSLSVIDGASDQITGTIEVGKGPQGLAATPDGRWVLVAVNGEDRIVFINTATLAVAASVPVAKPHTIAIRPGGTQAYVTSQEPGHFSLAVIDLAARKVSSRIALDKMPRDLEFGHDDNALYLTAPRPEVRGF